MELYRDFLLLFLKETGLIKPLTKVVNYLNDKLERVFKQ